MTSLEPSEASQSVETDLRDGMRPKVSVMMLTYNHERYVAQAIESVLSQKVDFDFELVIGEDCSADDTLRICEQYAANHPRHVRLLPSVKNLGLMPNFIRTWDACRGDYIACQGGDDYWISPDKLASQTSFMESHPEVSLSYHNADVVDESGTFLFRILDPDKIPTRSTLEDFLGGVLSLPSLTVMYRHAFVPKLPDWMLQMPFEDWPLHVLHATYGPIGFIPQTWAAYRSHRKGAWSGLDQLSQARQLYAARSTINGILGLPVHRPQQAILSELARRVSLGLALAGDPAASGRWLLRSWGHRRRALGMTPANGRSAYWRPMARHLAIRGLQFMGDYFPTLLSGYRIVKRAARGGMPRQSEH